MIYLEPIPKYLKIFQDDLAKERSRIEVRTWKK
jgi:hypothetical protein